eukprot:4093213-Amphidinium_carterae.2
MTATTNRCGGALRGLFSHALSVVRTGTGSMSVTTASICREAGCHCSVELMLPCVATRRLIQLAIAKDKCYQYLGWPVERPWLQVRGLHLCSSMGPQQNANQYITQHGHSLFQKPISGVVCFGVRFFGFLKSCGPGEFGGTSWVSKKLRYNF